MTARRELSAIPHAANAIRIAFDEDEPPALVFNEQAYPGALVSWAWCQLKALDDLLIAVVDANQVRDGEPDLAGSVRSIIQPVINALKFSELRASELSREASRSMNDKR